ncbi:hypothetical protein ACW6QP_02075 [Salegentibacter sp. HM20]
MRNLLSRLKSNWSSKFDIATPELPRLETIIKDGNWKVYSFSNDSLIAFSKPAKNQRASLSFSRISGLKLGNFWINDEEQQNNLGIGLRTINGDNQIVFLTRDNEFNLLKDDCISIIFSNRTALTFVVSPSNLNAPGYSGIKEAYTSVCSHDIQKLYKHEAIAWHYYSHETPETLQGNFDKREKRLLREMTYSYHSVLKKNQLI